MKFSKFSRAVNGSLWLPDHKYAYFSMIDRPTPEVVDVAGGSPIYGATCVIQETSLNDAGDESFNKEDFLSNIVLSGNQKSITGMIGQNSVSVVVNNPRQNKQEIESSPQCLALREDVAEFCLTNHCTITLRGNSIESCKEIFNTFKKEVEQGWLGSYLAPTEEKADVFFSSSSSSKPKP